jgi:hypothetical protein
VNHRPVLDEDLLHPAAFNRVEEHADQRRDPRPQRDEVVERTFFYGRYGQALGLHRLAVCSWGEQIKEDQRYD